MDLLHGRTPRFTVQLSAAHGLTFNSINHFGSTCIKPFADLPNAFEIRDAACACLKPFPSIKYPDLGFCHGLEFCFPWFAPGDGNLCISGSVEFLMRGLAPAAPSSSSVDGSGGSDQPGFDLNPHGGSYLSRKHKCL